MDKLFKGDEPLNWTGLLGEDELLKKDELFGTDELFK